MLHAKWSIGLLITLCSVSSADAILETHRTLRNFHAKQLQHFAHIQQKCSGESAEIDQQGRVIRISCDVDAAHMVLGCYTKNGVQIAQVVATEHSDFAGKHHACLAMIQSSTDPECDEVITDLVVRFCILAQNKGYQRVYLTVMSQQQRDALCKQGFVDTRGCQRRGTYVLKKESDQKQSSNFLYRQIFFSLFS